MIIENVIFFLTYCLFLVKISTLPTHFEKKTIFYVYWAFFIFTFLNLTSKGLTETICSNLNVLITFILALYEQIVT